MGGLWNYTPSDAAAAKSLSLPQTSPHVGLPKPVWNGSRELTNGHSKDTGNGPTPHFVSPLYDRLETNIPRGLMGFSDLDWPPDCPLFPTHDQVLEYIQRYAEDVRHLVQFQTQVVDVRKNSENTWQVRKQEIVREGEGENSEETFDAVAVASGHFDVPYIPPVQGMEEFNRAHPGVISHSKFYRKPEHYPGQKVIVVGSSASGVDIGAQIATECKSPLLQSQDTDLCAEAEEQSRLVNKPRILEYVVQDRCVRFADGR